MTTEEKVKHYDKCINAVHDYFVEDISQDKAAYKNGISRKSLQRFLNRLGIRKEYEK